MSAAALDLRAGELSFVSVRDGREITVRAQLHNPEQGPDFRVVDLLASPPRERDVLGPLWAGLAELPEGTLTGLSGITLPGAGAEAPARFTVSVMLADPREIDPADSEPIGPEVANVTPFSLAGRPGQRVAELCPAPIPAPDGFVLPLLTITYLASTEYGILTVAFGTAHIDAASVFAALFDTIAASVEVDSTEVQ